MGSAVFVGLLFTLVIFTRSASSGDSYLERYISVASDVHEFFGTSSVFFLISRNSYCLEDHTLMHSLIRDFSKKCEFTSIINFDELDKSTTFYKKRINRSLLVIFLRSISDVAELNGKLMSKSSVWLIMFIDHYGNSEICEYCYNPKENDFRLRFDTEMLVLCCDSLVLQEWWSNNGSHTKAADFAKWTNDKRDGFELIAPESFKARRDNLDGAELRIGLVKYTGDTDEARSGKIQGFYADIITELQRSVNFKVAETIQYSTHGKLNSSTKNWSGGVGGILRGEIDLLCAGCIITQQRLNIVDMTLPLEAAKHKLYVRTVSQSNAVKWSAYFKVFSTNVWIAMIVLIILASILLSGGKFLQTITRSMDSLITENCLHVWGIITQQGLHDLPAGTSLKVACISISMLASIIYSAYCAILVSILAVSSTDLPFTTVKGFIDDGSYRLSMLKDSPLQAFIANSSNPMYRKLIKFMIPTTEFPPTLMEAFDQVCREKIALYAIHDSALKLLLPFARAKCDIMTISTNYESAVALILPPDSQYTSVINNHIQRFKDTGLIDRINNKYYKKLSIIKQPKFDAFQLSDVLPAILIVIVGIIIALIIHFCQIFYLAINNCLRMGEKKIPESRNNIISDKKFPHRLIINKLRPINPNTVRW